MEVCAFLGIVGHYWRFIKGFACIAQPINEHLTGEGAGRKLEWMSLSALKAFEALKQACMTAPVLTFADYTKPFLLETDASKDGLGAVLSQKQVDGWYYPVFYGSRALMPHEKNYHLTKLEVLALKWVVTAHFKEYLVYLPFLVKTDNNPLTYIMMTPTLMPPVTDGLEPQEVPLPSMWMNKLLLSMTNWGPPSGKLRPSLWQKPSNKNGTTTER